MSKAKKIAICGAFCALLIAIQYVFNAVKGIELVTLFFYAFCFSFGWTYGVLVAVAYTFLRCFIYGFFPAVIILYLIYYPLFAVVAHFAGKLLSNRSPIKQVVFSSLICLCMTLIFTLLDDIVTPLFFSFDKKAFIAYFYQSIPTCLIQCACTVMTISFAFYPLKKAFTYLRKRVE